MAGCVAERGSSDTGCVVLGVAIGDAAGLLTPVGDGGGAAVGPVVDGIGEPAPAAHPPTAATPARVVSADNSRRREES
ncbi:hypothetical protein ACQBAU_02160 [Propionibacteriaceae bacterium Y2011]